MKGIINAFIEAHTGVILRQGNLYEAWVKLALNKYWEGEGGAAPRGQVRSQEKEKKGLGSKDLRRSKK